MYYDLKISWSYDGREGTIIETFGYPEFTREQAEDTIRNADYYWYEEGNGSCDCNRSRMINIEEIGCGTDIEFLSIEGLLDSIRNE